MYEKQLLEKGIVLPKPVDSMIEMDPKEYIVSITDEKGFITYANDYFVDISWYKKEELIGSPHNILRHPDMPKAAFKLVWDNIKQGNSIFALVKNLAKDGKYYWVVSEIEPLRNSKTGVIDSYIAYRKAASQKMIDSIEPIYKEMLEIEKTAAGVEGSTQYLLDILEKNNTTYPKFINKVIGNSGIFKLFFIGMKKIFKMKVLKELGY